MIRVNLTPSALGTVEDVGGDLGSGSADEIKRKGLTNIAIILLLPAALFLYGMQARPDKIRQMGMLQTQIGELQEFNQKEAGIVAEIDKIKEDERKVQQRIDALSQISLGRLVEVKVMDLIQTIIKERMWLLSFEVDDNKLTIDGMAQSEIDVTVFLEDLTKNILLSNVRLMESTQEVYEGQNFAKFRIQAMLEKSK
jgi:type IV pilus assembly protein PilN